MATLTFNELNLTWSNPTFLLIFKEKEAFLTSLITYFITRFFNKQLHFRSQPWIAERMPKTNPEVV